MGVIYFIVLFILMLVGVNYYDGVQHVKKLEATIDATIRMDWRNGIPLDNIFDTNKICIEDTILKGCDVLQSQIKDISVSLQTCLADNRSELCENFVEVINSHPMSRVLPSATAEHLPASPFYWSLPTKALESLSNKFNYRSEVENLWWDSWHIQILFAAGLLTVIAIVIIYSIRHIGIARARALEMPQQIEPVDKQVKDKYMDEHIQQLKEMELANTNSETKEAAEKQHADQLLAEKISIIAACKLAAEKAEQDEAREMLNAIFKTAPNFKQ